MLGNNPHKQRWATWLVVLALLGFVVGCEKSKKPAAQTKSVSQSEKTKRPMLWRIEGQKPSYLFGTIHFPDDRVLAIHKSVEAALSAADAVYVEIPMDGATQMKLAMKTMLPDGKTLKDVLPAELYSKVEKLFAGTVLPMMMVSRFKVWTVAVQVTLVDHLKELMSKTPLDKFIYEQAVKMKKEVGGIETVDEQIAVFDSLTLQEQIQMLEESIEEHEKNKKDDIDMLKVAIDLYIEGDEKKLMDKLLEEYDPEDPVAKKLIKLLFTDRNQRMAERIMAKIKASPAKSFFFAVGTGHMPGDGGILDRFRKAGIKVTRTGEGSPSDKP